MRKEVCSGPQNFAVAQRVEGLSQLIRVQGTGKTHKDEVAAGRGP